MVARHAKQRYNTGVIEDITRLRSSVNGNPGFLIRFTDGQSHRTAKDSTVANVIGNEEYQGVPVTVHLTTEGHIYYIEAAK